MTITIALLVGVVILAAVGLAIRSKQTERRAVVLREDALKHLFNCEYRENHATVESLSGALGTRGSETTDLLDQLLSNGLITTEQGRYSLTSQGRDRAIQLIRVHRLWETYFSEETGVRPKDWHRKAERLEHITDSAEAESLASRVRNPRWDPHGDPIPTADGDLLPARGHPLTDLQPGVLAEIIHLEDEPEHVFARLADRGLHPGMLVRVESREGGKVWFQADGQKLQLTLAAAANVSVVLVGEDLEMPEPSERLSNLKMGESAVVVGISHLCRGIERRRMLDLGVIPGTRVEMELNSASGDPMAYRIRGALIALRREQADLIVVHRDSEAAA